MELIQIEVVGLQSPQAAFEGFPDVLPAETGAAAANVIDPALAGPGDLAGQDDPFPHATGLQPVADDGLGGAIGLRPWRNAVQLRRVEEIHALFERVIHLRERLGLGVLLAEGHGAEADDGHVDVGVTQLAVFHDESLMGVSTQREYL